MLWHLALLMIYCASSAYTITAAINSLAQHLTAMKAWKIRMTALMCMICGASGMVTVTPASYAVIVSWNQRIKVYLKYGSNFIAYASLVYIYKISRFATDYRFLYKREINRLILYIWQISPFLTVVSITIFIKDLLTARKSRTIIKL